MLRSMDQSAVPITLLLRCRSLFYSQTVPVLSFFSVLDIVMRRRAIYVGGA